MTRGRLFFLFLCVLRVLCGAKSFAFISFCFRFAFALSSSYLLFPSHCPCSWIPDQKISGMTRRGLVCLVLAFTTYYSLPTIYCLRSWIPDQKTSGMTRRGLVCLVLAFTTYYSLPTNCCFSLCDLRVLCGSKSFAFSLLFLVPIY